MGGVLNRLLASCCALLGRMQGQQRHMALGDLAAVEVSKGRRVGKVTSPLVMNIYRFINIHDDLLYQCEERLCGQMLCF